MRWLFVIDPIVNLNPDTDTTFAIILECLNRGIETYIATIQDIF